MNISIQKCVQLFFLIVIVYSMAFFAACKKKETTPPIFTISGSWRVSYYYKANVDRTNDFSGYSFMFNTDSSLVASLSSISESGTWSYSSSTLQFVITIGTVPPLTEISKNWLLILKSDNELIFDEDSTVNDEEIHFLKN
ncbi:MAG: hypothetical protein WCI97_07405 [Bacteroidota bacterium]